MDYYEIDNDDEEFKEFLDYFDPQDFIREMIERGQIEKETEYHNDVYELCKNAVAYMLLKIRDTLFLYQVEVVEGSFKGKHHAWLRAGKYYVDLTLAQFIPEAPKLVVLHEDTAKKRGYVPEEESDPMEWVVEEEYYPVRDSEALFNPFDEVSYDEIGDNYI